MPIPRIVHSIHSAMQPLEIYHAPPGTGPNPWKVIIILEELSLPYTMTWIPYSAIKSAPYTSLNPNGRLPSIKDSNTGVTLFESGAIIEYLVETYDREQRVISYDGSQIAEKWLARSWLHFQMSGQGPMFGQKMWFTHFHAEKGITSVIERYGDETKRIVGVIESHLRRRQEASGDDALWLLGGKCTYADLAFVPWDLLLLNRLFPEGFDAAKEFPLFYQWHQRVVQRPAVKKAIEIREHCMATMEDSAKAVLPRGRYSHEKGAASQ
ncbi:hypothetical protein LTR09_011958 [Extremus antarcticus]|uniref:Glutathione S-transferase n=1 Tax=Extremus antarcticus TaxID=702011 RepID=A0AAJ0D5D9_9PEZI|nr:hypothetical protein LTR09_011958 [Extremus antarcticus]